jgi:hypothetical protein
MLYSLLHGLKLLSNNIIIKLSKYLPLSVTYHKVIKPIILELVTQFGLDDLHCQKKTSEPMRLTPVILRPTQ